MIADARALLDGLTEQSELVLAVRGPGGFTMLSANVQPETVRKIVRLLGMKEKADADDEGAGTGR